MAFTSELRPVSVIVIWNALFMAHQVWFLLVLGLLLLYAMNGVPPAKQP
jgi:hypothetical protein